MIEIFLLLTINILMLVTLLQVGQTLASFFVPRLELAKGISGTPQKFSAIYSLWGLSAVWKSREITWKSSWILVLALQTLMSAVFLSPIFTNEWQYNEKLLIPLIFLVIQTLIAIKAHIHGGEKDPDLIRRTIAALTGSIGLGIILYGLSPGQTLESWYIAGYILKWSVLAFLYVTLVSFLTFENSANVPHLVSRLSQTIWSLGLVMIFWPPHSGESLMSCFEQGVKAQATLFLLDVSRTMFAKVKNEFFQTIILALVLPLMFLASFLIVMGL